MSLRVTDVLNKYSGDGDVTVWLKQAHLAKNLLKLKDLAVVIPLFLDGPAFAVYDRLSDAEKQDANKIEVALRTAFAADKFSLVLVYLPYLSSIHEKANCIAILWTGSPHSLGSCLFSRFMGHLSST